MARFILPFFIVLFSFNLSYAFDANTYKNEVSSYVKTLQTKYNLKKINVKYNIFKINNNNYAALYILSGNDISIAACSALDDGRLSNCESAFFYGLNYNNASTADFSFNQDSIFLYYNMDLDKNKKPYTLTLKEKNNKLYFHTFSSKYDKASDFYSERLERAVYSDDDFARYFKITLNDVTPFTLMPHKFKKIEYEVKNYPGTAPYLYSILYKSKASNISVEVATDDNISVFAATTYYNTYDDKFNDRNDTYTAYICKPDFKECIEGNLAIYDKSEYMENIFVKDDYITFKAQKDTHDDERELYTYITYRLKNGKYYLDKIVEMNAVKVYELTDHISTIKYDSKGSLTIPFETTKK